MSWAWGNASYRPVVQSFADEELISSGSPVSFRNSALKSSWRHGRSPWIISTFIFALTSVVILVTERFDSGSFKRGFSTDLGAIRHAISLKHVRFTDTPSFTNDGEEYFPPEVGVKTYVGFPNKEVDDNWNELVKDRYFLLTETEAHETWGDEYTEYWNEDVGGYLAGLDVFHTLHCLDQIRQAFYPEHYPQKPIHGQMHRDHCLDHLRQMIMCYADTTPIPSKFFVGINQYYIDSNRIHTCRDFSSIRAWATERFKLNEKMSSHLARNSSKS